MQRCSDPNRFQYSTCYHVQILLESYFIFMSISISPSFLSFQLMERNVLMKMMMKKVAGRLTLTTTRMKKKKKKKKKNTK